jgi:hypothetical protein
MHFLKKSAILSLALFASAAAFAQEACVPNLVSILEQQADQRAFIRGKFARIEPQAQRAFTNLENLAARGEFNQILPENLLLGVIADEEMLVYVRNLDWLLGRLNDRGTLPADTREAVAQAARELLSGADLKVPPATVEARIAEYVAAPNARSLRRLLGDMEFDEVQTLMHGGDPLHPSPDSLVGRYLQESGAQTVIRSFSQSTEAAGPQGPQRLVIAISTASMPLYKKYFDRPELLIHTHAPNQGTLYFAHNGRAGSYANNGSFANPLVVAADDAKAVRFPSVGSIWPSILLKSTEGQRALQTFRLGSSSLGAWAQRPWDFGLDYCAKGGYTSCTHWFGNLPIGDRLVREYAFPGNVDRWVGNAVWERMPNEVQGNLEGRIQVLGNYDPNQLNIDPTNTLDALAKEKIRALVARVWKPAQGNEQLADVLGLRPHNLRGEFANPGWVAITLTGAAPQERVPFVFLSTADHRTPIAVDFPTQISAH